MWPITSAKPQERELAGKSRSSRRRLIDAALLVAFLLAAGLLAFEFDIFTRDDVTAQARELELEEALGLATLLTVGLLVFGFRRLQEQRREFGARIEAEIRMRKALELALLDPLTGMANRRHFDDTFNAAAVPKEAGTLNALLLLDLDHFKAINDSFGHPAGDEVLKIVSERLQANVAKRDLLSRLGGDEFAILAFDVGSSENVEALIKRLQVVVAQPIAAAGNRHRVSASFGFALFPQQGCAPDDIYRLADEALYRSKQVKPARTPGRA
jgi:diguanylate cyclase (GGDEF)-like protein